MKKIIIISMFFILSSCVNDGIDISVDKNSYNKDNIYLYDQSVFLNDEIDELFMSEVTTAYNNFMNLENDVKRGINCVWYFWFNLDGRKFYEIDFYNNYIDRCETIKTKAIKKFYLDEVSVKAEDRYFLKDDYSQEYDEYINYLNNLTSTEREEMYLTYEEYVDMMKESIKYEIENFKKKQNEYKMWLKYNQ